MRGLIEAINAKHKDMHMYTPIKRKPLKRYEIVKNQATDSFVVGHSESLEACIRTAKKLEKYPHKVQ